MPSPRKSSTRQRAIAAGYRSGLEESVAKRLAAAGISHTFESHTVHYTVPERPSKYTPDFIFPNGVIVETKGQFVTKDRQKHILIRDQHPDLDIRFVFGNPNNRISKTSSTTYADWCEKHGFPYAAKVVPECWAKEPTNHASVAAIEVAGVKPKKG